MDIYVSRLAAWAPGMQSQADWRTWAKAPGSLSSEDTPKPEAVPALLRRRLTRWSRMALEVATQVDDVIAPETPVIFSSRHGDTRRTERLLAQLAEQEALSPTAFSLSVHNAALGVYTIARQITAPSLAVAAGRDTLPQAWLEAQAWLHGGADSVLLVHVDEPLSAFYQEYADETELPAAVGLVLQRQPSLGAVRASLKIGEASGSPSEQSVMMQFLAWWYGPQASLVVKSERLSWIWNRDVELDEGQA